MPNFGIALVLATILVYGFGSSDVAVANGKEFGSPDTRLGQEKMTKLRFYVQDWVGGDSPNVWKVAQSNLSDVLPSGFGVVSVLDNLVTSGPDMDSEELGRIQGLIGLSDFREKALVMLLNLVFTKGECKGSTLSLLGRNPLNDDLREVTIVGGTGVFRMARGFAMTSTYAVDDAHTHGVIEYKVVVFHLDSSVGFEDF